MKKVIVITSGGTLEYIDSVRSIKNTSSGKLGAEIANELGKWEDVEIIYISNRYAVRPKVSHSWIETESVLDVERKVKDLLLSKKVDIFIHSMAVADYTVSGVEMDGVFYSKDELEKKKLSSQSEEMKILCKKAPKIIKKIKEWQPHVFLVGFKLLQDTTEQNLFEVGFNLLRKNRCNMVIGNDLVKIKEGNHEGLFIYPEKKYDKVIGKNNIAETLSSVLNKRAFCKRSKSVQLESVSLIPKEVVDEMKFVGEKLFEEGLLPIVDGGTYGNMSIKNEKGFFITGRNVDKGKITDDLLCEIVYSKNKNEPTLYKEIFYNGKYKPSIDTPIHEKIYEENNVSAILHLHTDDIFDEPMTDYNYPCGSMEERDSIVNRFSTIVQMKKHGIIIGDDSLIKCLEVWEELKKTTHLTPLLLENESHVEIFNEWKTHLKDISVEEFDLDIDRYYIIKDNCLDYGIVYLYENDNEIKFSLYTLEKFSNKGLGLGKKVLNILKTIKEEKDLFLLTNKNCGVVDYYEKNNFRIIKEDLLKNNITMKLFN